MKANENEFLQKLTLFIFLFAALLGGAYAQNPALHFDGSALNNYDYLEVTDNSSVDFTTSFTFETWVNFDQITETLDGRDWQFLFGKNVFNSSYGLMLRTEGSKLLRFYHTGFGTGFTDYTWSLSANTWYHLAVTFNGTRTAILIDGVEVASQTATSYSFPDNSNVLKIGASGAPGNTFNPYPLLGKLDEVRFWNIARTESEISSTKDQELTGIESGLVLYYNFNEGLIGGDNSSISNILDATSFNNHGIENGFALTGSLGNYVDGSGTGVLQLASQSAMVTYGAGPTTVDTLKLQVDPGKGVLADLVIDNMGASTVNWSVSLSDTLGFGREVIFNKANFAAWQLPENQDRITDNVYITRGDNKSIFNARTETTSSNSVSPENTEWSRTNVKNASSFSAFHAMHGGNPQSLIGDTATLHLIADDEYHEVIFNSFSGGNTGGGFGYTRTPLFDYLGVNGAVNGAIAAANSETVKIAFDASNLKSGLNYGKITLTSDDADNGTIEIVTELEVLPAASFSLSASNVSETLTKGDAATMKIFTISNNGTAALSWSSNGTTNRPSAMSQVSLSTSGGQVTSGSSQDVTVTFDAGGAAVEGTYEWPLVITSNDPLNAEQTLVITLHVIGVPGANVAMNTTPDPFNDTFVDFSSIATLDIASNGSDTLIVTSIASSEAAFVPEFDSVGVPPGVTYKLNVTFSPSTAGVVNGNLTFDTNDPVNPSFTIPISGTGVEPPIIDVAPVSITQSLTVNDTVSTQVTINNTGGSDLTWDVRASLTDAPIFATGPVVNFVSNTGQEDSVSTNVTIKRIGFGSVAGRDLYNKIEYPNVLSVQTTSTTVEWSAKSTVKSSPLDYGNSFVAVKNSLGAAFIGSTISMYIIAEDRYFDLEILTYDAPSGPFANFSYNRTEILPGIGTTVSKDTTVASGNRQFDVEFYGGGLTTGTFAGKYIISSNDPLAPSLEFPITLTVSGGAPDLSTTSTSLTATSVQVTQVDNFNLEIVNSGNSTLNVTNVTVDDPVFGIGATSFSIPALETYVLPLTFTPALAQTYNATLSIVSDDPANSPFDVALTGTGLEAPEFQVASVLIQDTLAVGATNAKMMSILNNAAGVLEWSIIGEVAFEKVDYADPNSEAAQDRISNLVWLTRGDEKPTYNYLESTNYIKNHTSILYGNGTTFSNPSYGTFDATFNGGADGQIGSTTSLYLVAEDRYFDLAYSKWTDNGDGGGFAYTRREAVPWLELGSLSGTITGINKTDVTATFKTNSLAAGDYEFTYDISANDPVNPLQTVTFQLHVTGTPDINVTFASDSVRFGDVIIGQTATLPVTVSNAGDSTLSVANIVFDDPAFAIDQTDFKVEKGKNVVLNVSFTPTAVTTHKAGFTITSDDPDESPITFGVIGSGIQGPDLNVNTNMVNLQVIAGGSESIDLTLSNVGQQSLNWNVSSTYVAGSEVFFEKPESADWTQPQYQDRISDNVWITRRNDGSLFNFFTNNNNFIEWAENKTVLFGPLPTYGSDLSNVFGGGSSMSSIPGNTLSLHLTEEDRYFDVYFNSWVRGNNSVGTGGFSYTRNEVASWLSISAESGTIAVSGADQTLTLSIDAAKLNAGTYVSNLVLGSNGVEPEQTVVVNLTVLGVPQISIVENALSFADIFVGNSTTAVLQITNTGNSTLTVSDITSDNSVFTIQSTSMSIEPNETVNTTVTFTPTAIQTFNGILTILSDDTSNPSSTVTLTGAAISPPTASVDIAELKETLFFGKTATQTFTIQNTGNADLEWNLGAVPQEVNFVKADNADWTIPANQDRITDNVWLTRGSSNDIFNIAVDQSDVGSTPTNTLWALGASVDVAFSDYENLNNVPNGFGDIDEILGQTVSLYSQLDQQYFDVVFTSFTSRDVFGGGFGYTRRAAVGPQYDAVSFSVNKGVIAPGGSQQVVVRFNPNLNYSGSFELPLQVVSNDPDNPRIDIPLSLTINGIIANNPVSDQIANEGFGSAQIDISSIFTDAQGDALTYTVVSSDETLVTVGESTNILTVTEVGSTGSTSIAITADDSKGSIETSEFTFRVNALPTVVSAIGDQSYVMGFGSAVLDVSNVFADSDAADVLSYSATSDDNGLVTAGISGSMLTLTQQARGSVNVTVTAADGFGGQVNDTFEVFVDGVGQTITFGSVSSVNYGNASFDLSATSGSSLAIAYSSSDPTVATVAGNTVTVVGAGSTTITASQSGDGTYNPASDVSQDLVVNKAVLNVSTSDQTISEGDALPSFDVSYSGFVNGEDASVLDIAPSANVSITDSSVPGMYDITVSGGSDNNYDFTYQNGTLTIDEVLGLLNKNNIKVYPNPVVDYLSISDQSVSTIEIFDLRGMRVLSQSVDGEVDLTNLDAGSYMIQLRDKSEKLIYTGRVIKN